MLDMQSLLATHSQFQTWLQRQPPGRVFDTEARHPFAEWLDAVHPDYAHFIQPGFVLVRRLDSRKAAWEADEQIELPDWACDFDVQFQFEIVDNQTGKATARETLVEWLGERI